MPMPKPEPKEVERSFIARFMSDEAMKKEFPNYHQRLAVAYQTWGSRND